MEGYRIVLASASPRRRELLKQIGLDYEVCPSHGEEQTAGSAPQETVLSLSEQKAQEVYERLAAQDGRPLLVIGADTLVACDGVVLGKPKDEEDAMGMLRLLQGRSHQVYTGVTVIWQEKEPRRFSFFECTQVEFFPMQEEEIRAYVATGEPMDKAGSYGIQGKCAAHIRGILGDYNNVVGLPVGRLYQELHQRRIL